MAGETEVETPAQPEVTEEKKEIAEAENKTEEKKGSYQIELLDVYFAQDNFIMMRYIII